MTKPHPITPAAAEEASNPSYWENLIGEKDAAAFLGISVRTIQAFRVKGDGPVYSRYSSRCIRYTRARLKEWADSRLRVSTSDDSDKEAA